MPALSSLVFVGLLYVPYLHAVVARGGLVGGERVEGQRMGETARAARRTHLGALGMVGTD
jgi:hypothetical protein